MPTIYDNQNASLIADLRNTLDDSYRADFCVGYFNLRGWQTLAPQVELWPGGVGHQARVIVGMNGTPDDELRAALRAKASPDDIDQKTVVRFRKQLIEAFRRQLTFGLPKSGDKAALLLLREQLLANKVAVKLHAGFPLHAKLYLCHQKGGKTPVVGYLGSSNLTLSGLLKQGELNIDVLEQDAALKLCDWFDARWNDRWSLDISKDLAEVLAESWVTPRTPYHIYLKIAYHLSREARAGQAEFDVPKSFRGELFQYQLRAVQIAARHVNKRGGAVIGDVVGLGKTMTAAAIASIFLDAPYFHRLLVLCPPNLVPMWESELRRFNVVGHVHAISKAKDLANMTRYQLVVIDESHNLRSGEGKTYEQVRDYLSLNDSNVILLSATPYNKHYADLYHQLRLFIEPDESIGIRPEQLIKEVGISEFEAHRQYKPDTLGAFSYSPHADDWRELMRLYLVRRTRSFIKEHYAKDDGDGRKYLIYPSGGRFYFPNRTPKTVTFPLDAKNPKDPYARLYSEKVVEAIKKLSLPRYGLEGYLDENCKLNPTVVETEIFKNLTRAGTRLIGFCRTNLFKRLESCAPAFLLSIERHIVRNNLFLHALNNNLPLPIGRQDATLLDTAFNDKDNEPQSAGAAQKVYDDVWKNEKHKFGWLRAEFFADSLAADLTKDNALLAEVLKIAGKWDAAQDIKLQRLHELVTEAHGSDKVLVFSQFADTVDYLETQLKARGVSDCAGVTGGSYDVTDYAHRFSPVSNKLDPAKTKQIRVLLATDVLSEGQNLQDAHVIINFDLPWAIIRLIQRAGRVDRIGQEADEILCYSFLPAEGIEKIITLRERLRDRLGQNADVLGSDERFFDDETAVQLRNLYHEKSGILDEESEGEVDLASYAFQIWDNARRADPKLEGIVPNLPENVAGAKSITGNPHPASPKGGGVSPLPLGGVGGGQTGAVVYVRTPADTDVLAQLDDKGNVLTQSQWAILKAAACDADTPAAELADHHDNLVAQGVEAALEHEKAQAGGLGKPSGARYKAYHVLKRHLENEKGGLFEFPALHKVVDALYAAPLRQSVADQLNSQFKIGATDAHIADLLLCLHEEARLIQVSDEENEEAEPRLICSLGLV